MKITWLGQAGLLFETAGKKILIDPYLSNSVAKIEPQNYRRIPIDERFLKIKPDVIVITHNHADHLDKETLCHYLTQESEVTVLAPNGAWQELRKFGGLKNNYVIFNNGTIWTEEFAQFRAVKAEHSDEYAIGVIISAENTQRKYIYYSFTTKVVKTDLYGNVIGTVGNILGHLGCIDYCDEDGKLYASLEYKQDKIGKDILALLGCENVDITEGFFIAIFDVEKITRLDMDAEKDDIMRVVRLKTVEEDFKGISVYHGKEYAHRYGCSGIDGVTIGPDFGCAKNSNKYLHVCYGIYGDVEREDNDHQIILQYDFHDWWNKAQGLQRNFLKDAYEERKAKNKYFVYTGNTTYGVQNLEYDEYTGDYFAFVYAGSKAQFPNYNTFFIDGSVKPKWQNLKGKNVEGWELSLRKSGKNRNGATGIYFSYGSMGAYSLGDGRFYFVEPDHSNPENIAVNAVLYQLIESENEWTFERL